MLAFSVPIARESGHLVRAIAEKATIDQALVDTGAAMGTGSVFHHPLPLSQPRAWHGHGLD